ncbi:hypothetical protein BOW52_10660 [Solemya elarraichensis gill symbiont]|uniref:Uncharacterized protein n=1 Tax=Solemya elarraichensis gill symbiont TaxID=1918949 RepID=A0A1T2KV72_9GAMM|nr:hypothetical protein BOW52_10660 [Solemya elarraichensis gill symbiont]
MFFVYDKRNHQPCTLKANSYLLSKAQQVLRNYSIDFTMQTFLSLKRRGIEEAHERHDQWFNWQD